MAIHNSHNSYTTQKQAENLPARRVPRRLKATHFIIPFCRYSSMTSGKSPCNGSSPNKKKGGGRLVIDEQWHQNKGENQKPERERVTDNWRVHHALLDKEALTAILSLANFKSSKRAINSEVFRAKIAEKNSSFTLILPLSSTKLLFFRLIRCFGEVREWGWTRIRWVYFRALEGFWGVKRDFRPTEAVEGFLLWNHETSASETCFLRAR